MYFRIFVGHLCAKQTKHCSVITSEDLPGTVDYQNRFFTISPDFAPMKIRYLTIVPCVMKFFLWELIKVLTKFRNLNLIHWKWRMSQISNHSGNLPQLKLVKNLNRNQLKAIKKGDCKTHGEEKWKHFHIFVNCKQQSWK